MQLRLNPKESIYLKLNVNGRPKLGGRGHNLPPELSWKLKYKMRKWIESRKSSGAIVVVSVVIVIVTELT
jgi:hypothetical protein